MLITRPVAVVVVAAVLSAGSQAAENDTATAASVAAAADEAGGTAAKWVAGSADLVDVGFAGHSAVGRQIRDYPAQ
uniref:RxLR effector candidate protein n=1 Tax=Hyaloperonospora arabidopsidis (strain Emoy2) TaxID=559515 RepID=M4BSY4_HYAAE